MDDLMVQQQGRRYVLAAIAFTSLFSLLVIGLNALTNASSLPTSVGRFLVSIFLWFMLYWARLVWILLASLGAIYAFYLGASILLSLPLVALLLLFMGAGYLWVAGLLVYSPSVNAFFTFQRTGKSKATQKLPVISR
ncbi:MAG: hypothetical protein H0T73_12535 [Ardenticatenales bacterium]|nr:hypothetical protein [Ardenticatenales bacterium]